MPECSTDNIQMFSDSDREDLMKKFEIKKFIMKKILMKKIKYRMRLFKTF